jgi:hypothetical protein
MSELACDIEEYRSNLLTAQKSYREHTRTFFLAAVVTFSAGAVLLYLNLTVVAVVFLALSIFLSQGSNHHHLLGDMLDAQWSLALLINKQAKQLEVLRWELKEKGAIGESGR